MMKLLATLLASMMFVAPVSAQNLPNRYDAAGIGTVNYSLNSGGSSYGQLFNSPTSAAWSLGYGTTQATSGTGVLTWNSSGQVGVGTAVPAASSALEVGSGNGVAESVRVTSKGLLETHANTAPVASSCGTTPSVVSGSDQAGDITLGSAAVATCTLTFASAFTNTPHCFTSNRSSKLVTIAQPTASSLVIVGSGAGGFGNANDIIDYFCIGHN